MKTFILIYKTAQATCKKVSIGAVNSINAVARFKASHPGMSVLKCFEYKAKHMLPDSVLGEQGNIITNIKKLYA